MAGRLADKVAIVVGAGSVGPGWGNGKATAVLFAREGASVLCVDINEAAAHETADIIRSEGGTAESCAADASKAADVDMFVSTSMEKFGKVDVLHNNVGVVEVCSLIDLAEEDWDRLFAINLKSCFLSMKQVIPIMARQGGGSIINTSSIASIRHTGVSYPTYYATKAAMNHLTKTTAVQHAPQQIRVNAVLPGLMKTPMAERSVGFISTYGGGDVDAMWRARDAQVPMGHMGDAWDVAYAALFLASDESRYVTGLELIVDGGMTVKCA